MNTTYKNFLTAALANVKAHRAEFDADVHEWYTSGDGVSSRLGGRGYAYPVCIHGMSQWTDYDNICGGCEEGESDFTVACGIARTNYREFQARLKWAMSAPASLPSELRTAASKWTAEALPPCPW